MFRVPARHRGRQQPRPQPDRQRPSGVDDRALQHPPGPPRRHRAARDGAHNTSATARWGIQVGTFSSEKAARQAATAAAHVTDAGDAHVERTTLRGKPAWRAQLTGLTAREAQSACGGRGKKKSACFVVRPEGGEMASR